MNFSEYIKDYVNEIERTINSYIENSTITPQIGSTILKKIYRIQENIYDQQKRLDNIKLFLEHVKEGNA